MATTGTLLTTQQVAAVDRTRAAVSDLATYKPYFDSKVRSLGPKRRVTAVLGQIRLSGDFGRNRPIFDVASVTKKEMAAVTLLCASGEDAGKVADRLSDPQFGLKVYRPNHKVLKVEIDTEQLYRDPKHLAQLEQIGQSLLAEVLDQRNRHRNSIQRLKRDSIVRQQPPGYVDFIDAKLDEVEAAFLDVVDHCISCVPTLEEFRPKTRISVKAAARGSTETLRQEDITIRPARR